MKPIFVTVFVFLVLIFPAKSQTMGELRDLQSKVDSLSEWIKFQEKNIRNFVSNDSTYQKSYELIQSEMEKIKHLNQSLVEELKLLKENLKENQKDEILEQAPQAHDSTIKYKTQPENSQKEYVETNRIERSRSFDPFCLKFIKDLVEIGDSSLQKYYYNPQQIYLITKTVDSYSYSEIIKAAQLGTDPVWSQSVEKFRTTKFAYNEGTKPQVNCEMRNFYDKQGIYGGNVNSFKLVSEAFIELEGERVRDNVLNKMKYEESLVKKFLFSTDGDLCFYFIHSNGSWRLYCIEIEVPCVY